MSINHVETDTKFNSRGIQWFTLILFFFFSLSSPSSKQRNFFEFSSSISLVRVHIIISRVDTPPYPFRLSERTEVITIDGGLNFV